MLIAIVSEGSIYYRMFLPATYLLISITAYLFGMIPTALLVVYVLTGKDVRSAGSENMGALNTLRRVKKEKNLPVALFAFLIVAGGDMLKAIGAVLIAQQLFGKTDVIGLTLATFFVVLGHNYPIILGFKGGRGAASLMGIVIYFNIKLFFIWILIIFISMLVFEFFFTPSKKTKKNTISFLTHAVSEQILGRLVGEMIALIPFYLYGGILFYPALAGTLLVILRHNKRLIRQFQQK